MSGPLYHIVESPTDILTLQQPGTIRWATGHPDSPRSLTWTVVGARNSDDVYVGTRGLMGAAKLSLHQSGVWRLAGTPRRGKNANFREEFRLIERYEATTELAPGWVHAVRIRTPSTTFRPAIAERRPRDKQPIRFYPTPDLPLHLEYHVVLGDSAAQVATVNDAITVGQMALTSGKRVWIIAAFWEIDEVTQQVIDLANENAAKGARQLWIRLGQCRWHPDLPRSRGGEAARITPPPLRPAVTPAPFGRDRPSYRKSPSRIRSESFASPRRGSTKAPVESPRAPGTGELRSPGPVAAQVATCPRRQVLWRCRTEGRCRATG